MERRGKIFVSRRGWAKKMEFTGKARETNLSIVGAS